MANRFPQAASQLTYEVRRAMIHDELIRQLSNSLRSQRQTDNTLRHLKQGFPISEDQIARDIVSDRIKDAKVSKLIDQVLDERESTRAKYAHLISNRFGLSPSIASATVGYTGAGKSCSLNLIVFVGLQTPLQSYPGSCSNTMVPIQVSEREQMVDQLLAQETRNVLTRDVLQSQAVSKPLVNPYSLSMGSPLQQLNCVQSKWNRDWSVDPALMNLESTFGNREANCNWMTGNMLGSAGRLGQVGAFDVNRQLCGWNPAAIGQMPAADYYGI